MYSNSVSISIIHVDFVNSAGGNNSRVFPLLALEPQCVVCNAQKACPRSSRVISGSLVKRVD